MTSKTTQPTKEQMIELCKLLRSAVCISEQADIMDAIIDWLRAPDADDVPAPICGCREAGCQHTPVVQLSRAELVKAYKERIRDLTKQVEELTLRAPDGQPVAWIKGHVSHTDAGMEYDEEAFAGRDPPPGTGWHPLYAHLKSTDWQERDAARYHYLRNRWWVAGEAFSDYLPSREDLTGAGFDEAIDAALSALPQPAGGRECDGSGKVWRASQGDVIAVPCLGCPSCQPAPQPDPSNMTMSTWSPLAPQPKRKSTAYWSVQGVHDGRYAWLKDTHNGWEWVFSTFIANQYATKADADERAASMSKKYPNQTYESVQTTIYHEPEENDQPPPAPKPESKLPFVLPVHSEHHAVVDADGFELLKISANVPSVVKQEYADAIVTALNRLGQGEPCPVCNGAKGKHVPVARDWGIGMDQVWEMCRHCNGTGHSPQPAADGVVVEQWQPIETAPKDGSLVFLYWPTMSITRYPVVGFHNGDDFGWSLTDRDYGEVFPTHWCELPPPPRTALGRAEKKEDGK